MKIESNFTDLLKELFRYSLVGILRTILGVLLIFLPQNFLGVHYVLANLMGYSVGLVVGFLFHKNWTFKSNDQWRSEVAPYLITFGISYGINMAVLLFTGERLGLGKNISQALAIVSFSSTNFILNKFWTFG